MNMLAELLIMLKNSKSQKEKEVYFNMLAKIGVNEILANRLLKEV